nr:MAG TPA: hypothetical protein [Caudoviricetes sp.]
MLRKSSKSLVRQCENFVLSTMLSIGERFEAAILRAPFSMQWLNSRLSLMRPKIWSDPPFSHLINYRKSYKI